MHRDMYDTRESEPKGSAMRDIFAEHGSELDEQTVLRVLPDMRGLPVEDASGISVGRLWGSLAEADTGLVRYIDLDLSTLARHVLVPIGHARVRQDDPDHTHIRLRAALLEELEQIPPFPADVGHITDPFERALLEAYGRSFHGERYYAHPAYDHSGLYAGEHPVVAEDAGADAEPLTRMAYLPGWRVASGEPDIRGWPLVLEGDAGRVTVRDLIVDTGAQMVRYVVVDAPDDGGTRLLPIGYLHVDDASGEVRAAGMTRSDVTALPAYDGGGVTREHEERNHAALRARFTGRRRYLLPDFRASAGS